MGLTVWKKVESFSWVSSWASCLKTENKLFAAVEWSISLASQSLFSRSGYFGKTYRMPCSTEFNFPVQSFHLPNSAQTPVWGHLFSELCLLSPQLYLLIHSNGVAWQKSVLTHRAHWLTYMSRNLLFLIYRLFKMSHWSRQKWVMDSSAIKKSKI